MPDCTTVYDPQTQEAKLVTWEAYLRTHKPPPAGHYTTVYDPKTQSCKLVTWRDYLEYHKANDMKKPQQQQQQQPQKARRAKKMPDCTTVYDPQTQEAKLVTWEAYLRTHKQPPAGHYTTVYDPKTQSCKLVTWRDYLEYHKANDMKKQQQQQQQQQQQPQKARRAKKMPDCTTVYDPQTQ